MAHCRRSGHALRTGRKVSVRSMGPFVLCVTMIAPFGCIRSDAAPQATGDASPLIRGSDGRGATAVLAAPAVHAAPAPSGPSGPSPAAFDSQCRAICDRSRTLKCKNADECMSHCTGMATVTHCQGVMTAFYQCLLGRPVQDWECAEDGVAAIREGFCDSEQGRVVSCMESKR